MSILSQAQLNYSKFFVDDVWDDSYGTTSLGARGSVEKLDFYKRFYGCLLGDKFGNEMTTFFVKNPGNSIREAINLFNRQNPDKNINVNTGVSQVNYCSVRIKKVFDDENMLSNILVSDKTVDEKYQKQLNEFIALYGEKKNFRQYLVVNVPASKINDNVTEEEFIDFLRILEPYTRKYVRNIQSELNSRTSEAGYFNHIMAPGIVLNDTEKKHKQQIEILLGIREGSTDFLKIKEEPVAEIIETPEVEATEKTENKFEKFNIITPVKEQEMAEPEELKPVVKEEKEELDFDLEDDTEAEIVLQPEAVEIIKPEVKKPVESKKTVDDKPESILPKTVRMQGNFF